MKAESIPGVLLAAGDSSRFERGNKLLLLLAGQPVIYHTAKILIESRLDPVLLVTGFESNLITKALGDLSKSPKLKIVLNNDWSSGKALSVNSAIRVLPPDAHGVLFMPGDMPLMTASLINRTIESFVRSGCLTFPLINSRKGHPVIFPPSLWQELLALTGEQSAMSIARKYWDQAEKIELTDGEEVTQLDIDTLEDFRKIETLLLSEHQ